MNWQRILIGLAILAALYVAGVGTGAALWYGHVQTKIVTAHDQARAASETVLPKQAAAQAQIQADQNQLNFKESDDAYGYPAACNVKRQHVSLLNLARTGVSDATAVPDAEGSATSALTESAELEAHSDCAVRYRQLAADHDALIDWLNATRGKH